MRLFRLARRTNSGAASSGSSSAATKRRKAASDSSIRLARQEIVGVVDRGGQYEPRQALAGERGGVAKGLLLFRRQAEVEATSQSLGHVRNVDVLRRRLIGVDAARSVSPWRPNEVLLFPTFAHRHSERVRLVGVTQFRGLGAQSD